MKLHIHQSEYPKPTIATYYMDYGKGERVIDLSIWTHTLIDNKAFVKYFDDTIIPLALGRISSLHVKSLPPIIAEATRPSGAIVTYSIPSVSNSTNTQSVIDCKPTSGSFFPIGNTIVKCTVKDDKNATT